MGKKLPVYELKINEAEDSFVQAIALVDEPAIESNWIAFANQQMLFKADDAKHELIGAAMIPDMKIYRRDNDGSEYEVFFSADTIREISQVYFKRGFQTNLNIQHSATPAKSFVFQSYIVDSTKGMNSPKGLNLPDGSWVVGVKVTDEQVWNDIKGGKTKGFSVEGLFEFFQKHKQDEDAEILEALQKIKTLLEK